MKLAKCTSFSQKSITLSIKSYKYTKLTQKQLEHNVRTKSKSKNLTKLKNDKITTYIQAISSESNKEESNSVTLNIPESSETAKTIASIVNHGTLSTVSKDGHPLGTYVTYVLDNQGNPIIRLKANAVHTANLDKNKNCSLFIIPELMPARRLARVSLLGSVASLEPNEIEVYKKCHNEIQEKIGVIGVDSLKPSDLFYRLLVEKVFYVGGFASQGFPETITQQAYIDSEPDPLRNHVPEIVEQWNKDHMEDVIRICQIEANIPVLKIIKCELQWIDRLGMYFKYKKEEEDGSETSHILRVPFPRVVDDERDARSIMTMAAHLAWEKERNYIPKIPFSSLQKS